ncbi:MAG: gephyrin-like molybdotransferase Glp [Planctomycetota bacterium]
MRTPDEAIAEILKHAEPHGRREDLRLSEAVGRVLAAEIRSDLDLPPFEKSAMDGFAVRSADFEDPDFRSDEGAILQRIGESRAGKPLDQKIEPGQCAAIYTGAELPEGADAVVMVEKSEDLGDERIRLSDAPASGRHVCHRGEDIALDQIVLPAGRRVRVHDLGALASVGADPLTVFERPKVAILTTGDELVPVTEKPSRGQIRESNTLCLEQLALRAGAEVITREIVRDDRAAHLSAFGQALDGADVLLTSGGVSAGKYDLVGETLEQLGCEQLFHKVAIKPGKPIWFGKRGRTLVFGLPGNPVSTMTCHEVFVRPALALLGGEDPAAEEERRAPSLGRWCGDPPRAIPRQQNLPVDVRPGKDGVVELHPVAWRGSADLIGLTRARGLAISPAGVAIEPGQVVQWRSLDS